MALNLYADLNMAKRRMTGLADSVAFDSQDASGIEKVLEAASRRVDGYCGRHFFALTATRVLDGNGRGAMVIPDLLAATSVRLDEGQDGTFEVTLTGTDYSLRRHAYHDPGAKPSTQIRLKTNGQKSAFSQSQDLVEIGGRWGFTEDTELTTRTGTLDDAADTTLTLSGSDATMSQGQTLLIESEQMYVVSYNQVSTVTVVRGVNGTTAAAHAAQPIRRFVYIPDVVEATLEIASALWKGRETGYVSSTITNPVIGSIDVFPGMPAQAKQLLMPYRIIPI